MPLATQDTRLSTATAVFMASPPLKATMPRLVVNAAALTASCLVDLGSNGRARPRRFSDLAGSTVRLFSATFRVPIAVTGNCIRETKQQQASTTPAEQTTAVGGF